MKTSQGRKVAVGAILLLVLAAAIAAQKAPASAEALYQEALLKKDAAGDLDGAIKIFAQVLTDFPKERRIAGLAQLQIGICYEKQGLAKAGEAYRKVLADFGDQAETARIARERLTALAAAGGSPAGAGGLVLRKLIYPEGKVSPDGKFIARENDQMDGFTVYEVGTGKDKCVVLPPSDDGACCYTVEGWTPSSQKIVLSAFVRPGLGLKLHLADIDGRDVKIITRLDTRVFMDIGGFSPDEKSLYVLVRSPDWAFQAVGHISVGDGKYAEILNLGKVSTGSLGISPDGEMLALTIFHSQGGLDSDISIMRADGQDLKPLVSGPSADQFLGWMPDNRGILFTSTRLGEQAIWALPVTRGQASGEPTFVKGIEGFISASGFTKAGTFFYTDMLRGQDVYIVPVNFDAGKRISEPVKTESVYFGRTRTPFWAPDGKSLAYIFATTQELDPFCRYILKIRTITTGRTKDILLDFKPAMYLFAYGWTSDGTAVIVRGEANGKTGLWRIAVSGGESQLIYESSRVVAWLDDGNVVFETSPTPGDMANREISIVRKDLQAGTEQELFRGKPGEILNWMSVSPDEKLLGFMINDMMSAERAPAYATIPEEGGPQVARINEPGWGSSWSPLFFWAPRNRGGTVVLLRSGAEGERSELRYYPRGSGKEERRLEFGEKVAWGELAFSPDGNFLAYVSDVKTESTFWAVENYLPAKK